MITINTKCLYNQKNTRITVTINTKRLYNQKNTRIMAAINKKVYLIRKMQE